MQSLVMQSNSFAIISDVLSIHRGHEYLIFLNTRNCKIVSLIIVRRAQVSFIIYNKGYSD